MDENTHHTQADPKTSDTTSDRSSDSGAGSEWQRLRLRHAVHTLTVNYLAELESTLNTFEQRYAIGIVSMDRSGPCQSLRYQISLYLENAGSIEKRPLVCCGRVGAMKLSSD